jgi:hypothetical protein
MMAASLLCAIACFGCGGGAETSPTSAAGGSSPSAGGPSGDKPTAPGQKGLWSVVMGGRGLDVSACGFFYGICSQGVNVDANGAFHEVWSSATPNLLTVDGTMTPTTFTATLRCVGSGATGSMSATVNGADYTGTATMSGTTVSIRVAGGNTGPC